MTLAALYHTTGLKREGIYVTSANYHRCCCGGSGSFVLFLKLLLGTGKFPPNVQKLEKQNNRNHLVFPWDFAFFPKPKLKQLYFPCPTTSIFESTIYHLFS